MVFQTKKQILKKNMLGSRSLETRQEDRIHYESAYMAALNALNLKNINIKAKLKEFTVEQLEQIFNELTTKTHAKFGDRINHIAEYMKELEVLNIVEYKVQHAKTKLKQIFIESFTIQYTKINGNWNLDKFINEVETQIEKLKENNNNMEADI